MKHEQLAQGNAIQKELDFTRKDIESLWRLREKITDSQDEKQVIEDAWRRLHLFNYSGQWQNALQGKIIKVLLETIDEQLTALDKQTIELEKAFDKL